nr:MAG TPA: hypothetical protein [Caudoviricetes sp.]
MRENTGKYFFISFLLCSASVFYVFSLVLRVGIVRFYARFACFS